MLSKHYTKVLTFAILVAWGIAPKSLASSDKVNSNSFLEDKLTRLKKDTSNNDSLFSNLEEMTEAVVAQDVSPEVAESATSTEENQSAKLWWLAPLIFLVPLLGFLLYKYGSQPVQADEEQTTAANVTSRVVVSASTPENVTSELAVDSSVSDKSILEDIAVAKTDKITPETVQDSEVLDNVQQLTQNAQTQAESYDREFDIENEQLLEKSNALGSLLETEEKISEALDTSKGEIESELVDSQIESTLVSNENLDNSSVEEFATPETIAQSQPNFLAETEELKAQIELEQTEPITDQDLTNISEWLNEKIDSNNKDISVMDDFWDNLSSIAEEINSEIPPEQTEPITDRELANISEWLNEKVNTAVVEDEELEPSALSGDPKITPSETSPNLAVNQNSNLNDTVDLNLDNLADRVEDMQHISNEKLRYKADISINLEEEPELNTKTKEGISDSTSNSLEDFLNENSSQEHKQSLLDI